MGTTHLTSHLPCAQEGVNVAGWLVHKYLRTGKVWPLPAPGRRLLSPRDTVPDKSVIGNGGPGATRESLCCGVIYAGA